MNSGEKFKILVADDESQLTDLIIRLTAPFYEGIPASNGEEALELIKKHANELVCVVSDFQMGGMTGIDLRVKMLEHYRDIPFILFSGVISRNIALAAIDANISSFIEKPFDNKLIVETIKKFAATREESLQEKIILEQIFIEESSNILEDLEQLIMSLEQNPSDIEVLNTVFRLVHTIKGSSGVLDTNHIRDYVHKFEDLLSKLKNGTMTATPDIISVLLSGFDVIGQMIAALKSKAPWTKDTAEMAKIFDIKDKPSSIILQVNQKNSDHAKTEVAKDSVNVPAYLLDEFMELSGEITVIRNMVNKLVRVIEKEAPGKKNVQHLGDLLDEMHKINSGMQVKLVETRKVPLSKVFRPLPRVVRETARALGKNVNFKVDGDDIRVDTSIAQALSESLIHIIRNSVDHGVENPQSRLSSGKSKDGTIAINASEVNDEIVISISDDGGGLNASKIKAKAVEKGLYSAEEVEQLSEKSIFAIIFQSGFSTAQAVSDVSGRGVGMDMVRSSIQNVKGRIDIDSKMSNGTTITFTMPIPKSVLIISSLVVDVAGSIFALPQESIVRLIRVERAQIKSIIKKLEGANVIHFQDALLPLVDLAELLNLRPKGSTDYYDCDIQNILILRTNDRAFGLSVDNILDSEEIVVKAVGDHLDRLKVYSGATFMGDGTVGLILNADGLAAIGGLNESKPREQSIPNQLEAIKNPAQEILVFKLWADGTYGIPLHLIHRLEEIPHSNIQKIGSRDVIIYRQQTVPIIDLTSALQLPGNTRQLLQYPDLIRVFVMEFANRFVLFSIKEIVDVSQSTSTLDTCIRDRIEIAGTLDVDGKIVSIVDPAKILEKFGFTTLLDITQLDSKPVEPLKKVSGGEGWGVF